MTDIVEIEYRDPADRAVRSRVQLRSANSMLDYFVPPTEPLAGLRVGAELTKFSVQHRQARTSPDGRRLPDYIRRWGSEKVRVTEVTELPDSVLVVLEAIEPLNRTM